MPEVMCHWMISLFCLLGSNFDLLVGEGVAHEWGKFAKIIFLCLGKSGVLKYVKIKIKTPVVVL